MVEVLLSEEPATSILVLTRAGVSERFRGWCRLLVSNPPGCRRHGVASGSGVALFTLDRCTHEQHGSDGRGNDQENGDEYLVHDNALLYVGGRQDGGKQNTEYAQGVAQRRGMDALVEGG